MRRGLEAYGRGDLPAARQRFDEALAAAPGDPEALFMRGTIRLQSDDLAGAIQDLAAAVAAREAFPKAWNNLGVALGQAGRREEATEAFERALTQDPTYAEAPFNAGNALVAAGDPAAAEKAYRQALAIRPGYQDAERERAGALLSLGRIVEATEILESLVSRRDDDADAWLTLGNAHRAARRPALAEGAYRRALSLRPAWPSALNNLGAAFGDEGRMHKAANFYQRALALDPGYAEATVNLATALRSLGQWAEAEATARRGISLKPMDGNAWLVLGNVLKDRGAPRAAEDAYRRAATLDPLAAAPVANLAAVLKQMGDAEGAAAQCREALERDPDQPVASAILVESLMHCASWTRLKEAEARLDAVVDAALARGSDDVGESPFLSVIRCTDPARNLLLAKARSRRITHTMSGQDIERRPPKEGAGSGPLHIAYLSADLQSHATAHLMAGLFERHDRSRVQVTAYSYGADDGGAHRQRIRAGCDAFVDIADLDARHAAQRIHDDGVDILVDLKGHTEHARLEICALRPAPIQVSWLGFPGSTGAPFIDYALVDDVTAPAGDERWWTEQLVRLPGSYQVNDLDQAIGPATTRGEHGLSDEAFVFCSFNQPYKIRPSTWSAWMRLLREVPGSQLWLLSGTSAAEQNLVTEATHRGVDPARIVFAPLAPKPRHLARIGLADLALDPFEIGGHTTTSDALWARVPAITVLGDHFASRVAASLLEAVGLPELVAPDSATYEALALDLASSPERLIALRGRLADREQTTLFDTSGFAAKLERCYEIMWVRHLSGRPPAGISSAEASTNAL